MAICNVYRAVLLISLGSLYQSTGAADAKSSDSTMTMPVTFGLTKAKRGQNINETVVPNVLHPTKEAKEVKAVKAEISPPRVVKDRTAGTITIKPLAMNFANLTIGMARKSQLINGYPKDPYCRSFGMFSNQAGANGTSYDLELGVMLTSTIEAFTILGINYQRPISNIRIINNNPLNNFDNFLYSFKSRKNYNVSLGGRYCWNTQKPWFPFLGLMGTVIFQDQVRANVYAPGPNPFVPTWIPIGLYSLQGRKRLWGGTLQAGADYQFTDKVAITLLAGLQYTQRSHMTYTSIGGKQITCRDNRSLWNVPVMAALKFTL